MNYRTLCKKTNHCKSKRKRNENDIEKEFSNQKGIKYQLIESKLIEENNIDISSDAVKDYAKEMVKKQMAMYGQNKVDDEELNSIVERVTSNQDELKRIYQCY